MHNIHYLKTRSKSAEEACNYIENYVEDWGNENNYFSVCGSFNSDGSKFHELKGFNRWGIRNEAGNILTFKEVEEHINNNIDSYKEKENPQQILDNALHNDRSGDWYTLELFAKRGYQIATFKNKERFDISTDEYFAYQYDEFGLTNTYEGDENDEEFIVMIDMHS